MTGTAVEAPAFLAGVRRLVVIAPHPDDDVLGCGGIIAAAAALRCAVQVVYVTDGSASHIGSAAFPPARLREVREAEARLALRELGVATEPAFLRYPDSTLQHAPAADVAALRDAVAAAIADGDGIFVLGPWLRDPHADHEAVARIDRPALRRRPGVTLFEYTVWLDERGTAADRPAVEEADVVTVGVGPYVSRKRAALAAHRSQLGGLIDDAREAFVLPPGLVAGAGRSWEHLLRAR